MSIVLITGAATGIGNLTANALARDGHTVFASMRSVAGRNAARANELVDLTHRGSVDLRVLELDVQSQESVDQAVRAIIDATGRVDAVIHNAGHLYLGYVEAFTAEDLARVLDINAVGVHRVNRAVLPHMRERRSGTLVYVGSTTTVDVPPFLGPYVASKFAFDALAQTTSYEVSQFGIETTIVMPGAFTQGTEHFPNASHASDTDVTHAYAALDSMVARYDEATENLFGGADADPAAVAQEISRLLALPVGTKPFRSVVDFTGAHVEQVNAVAWAEQKDFITRLGFAELLQLKD
jgi:NAD(P)-dependent dehydrogenase (short-subunit alcohol dehydrogenase family)